MGDGVNIAARLESICQPGAICLSEDAYRQVTGRLDLAVTDLGPTELKNIGEPILMRGSRAARNSRSPTLRSASRSLGWPSTPSRPFRLMRQAHISPLAAVDLSSPPIQRARASRQPRPALGAPQRRSFAPAGSSVGCWRRKCALPDRDEGRKKRCQAP
jgi:hypothetical protein